MCFIGTKVPQCHDQKLLFALLPEICHEPFGMQAGDRDRRIGTMREKLRVFAAITEQRPDQIQLDPAILPFLEKITDGTLIERGHQFAAQRVIDRTDALSGSTRLKSHNSVPW